ncbi:MAG: hypothetical protein UR12_C0012G0017 [candidate division TM6 bacterium GW2011_GWF2_30_66]|jgi:hypothetical protein|nr:MAG: hypothetical protein UR12_C0012G0017 [candidate division TM6 bacterium GW2011_GWF2_30_66]
MNKKTLFLSLILLVSAKFASANYLVHNETNKYGYGNDITVYNDYEAGGVKIKVGETKEIKMDKNAVMDRLKWVDGKFKYEIGLRYPKDVYIYSPSYLKWEYQTLAGQDNSVISLTITKQSGILKGIVIQ